MKILDIPYHQFLGLKQAENDEFIFQADAKPEYHNHLGNVHACVQLSLAEASSGEFLLRELFELKDDLIPVIRNTEAKYHKPANGFISSKAQFHTLSTPEVIMELTEKNRTLVKVKTEVYDEHEVKTLTAIFEWFIIKK
jgi:homogentisate 1,2-dioxygenase